MTPTYACDPRMSMPLSATSADRDQAAALVAIQAGGPRYHDLSAVWTSFSC